MFLGQCIGMLEICAKKREICTNVKSNGFYFRFNGYDQRLDRELEAVVMVMEAFEGFETRVRYDIVGHSGESRNIPFVNEKKPPADSNARLETIKVRLDFCLKLNCFSK